MLKNLFLLYNFIIIKKMKDNNVNSLKTTFNAFPFVISSEEITLTQELIFLIQQESKNFSRRLKISLFLIINIKFVL